MGLRSFRENNMNTCRVCTAEIPVTGRRGRPSHFCSDPCRNRHYYEKRKARGGTGFTTCSAGCGRPMQLTATTAENPTCLPCRSAARAARLEEQERLRAEPQLRHCASSACDRVFVAQRRTRRFCSSECLTNQILADERIRDGNRRRDMCRAQMPALTWQGVMEAGLLEGPAPKPVTVRVRLHLEEQAYDVYCPTCKWMTDWLDQYEQPAWGCQRCYLKIALLAEPAPFTPNRGRAVSYLYAEDVA